MNFSLSHTPQKRSSFENILSAFSREISLATFEYNVCYYFFWALIISITLGLVEAILWEVGGNDLKIQWGPQVTKWRGGIKGKNYCYQQDGHDWSWIIQQCSNLAGGLSKSMAEGPNWKPRKGEGNGIFIFLQHVWWKYQ